MAANSPRTSNDYSPRSDASVVLAGIRRRHNEMLERERERRRRIGAACKPFARARAAIAAAEAAYQKTAEELEQRRANAEARRDTKVNEKRQELAAAVQAIRRENLSPAELASLLDLSQAELRDLTQVTVDAATESPTAPAHRSDSDRSDRSGPAATAQGTRQATVDIHGDETASRERSG